MERFPVSEQLDLSGIDRKIAEILSKPLPEAEYRKVCRELMAVIDLTTLDGKDNHQSIEKFCRKALSFGESGLPLPAAVCTYSPFIRTARKILEGTGIRVAAVGGAFPSGQAPLGAKLEEARYIAGEGANEIDIVISRGTFLAGGYGAVSEEISALREATRGLTMKVILETGELISPDLVARAGEIAIGSGADFIKTSTGKCPVGATPEAVYTMARLVSAHSAKAGRLTGIKPSGGISEPQAAADYWRITRSVMGTAFMTRDHFRIGASRLADNLAFLLLHP